MPADEIKIDVMEINGVEILDPTEYLLNADTIQYSPTESIKEKIDSIEVGEGEDSIISVVIFNNGAENLIMQACLLVDYTPCYIKKEVVS